MQHRAFVLVVLLMVVGGCASRHEYRHVYSLDAAVESPAAAESTGGGPEFELQRVLIPDYLDTTDIPQRVGAHEIRESSTGRFAERLSLGVTHALRSDVAARLPRDAITLSRSAAKPVRQILVTVDTFDVWPNGRCVLVADWTVLNADRKSVLSIDRGTFTTAPAGRNVTSDEEIVSAMAEAVRQLADSVAVTIKANAPSQVPDSGL